MDAPISLPSGPVPPDREPDTSGAPHPDAEYFLEDGDFTFCIQDVLFKLPKFTLCLDRGSMFYNMFHDIRGDAAEVIPLDDSPEDFRFLCWAMFAPRSEMHAVSREPDDIDVRKFMRILEIAHKYMLRDLEGWAWSVAQLKNSGQGVPQYLDACSQLELARLLGLGLRCTTSAPDLLPLVETAWIKRIRRGDLSHSFALTTCELHGRWDLQADVYIDLRRRLFTGPALHPPASILTQFKLTDRQLDALLLGHARLTLVCSVLDPANDFQENLPAQPLCTEHEWACQDAWRSSVSSFQQYRHSPVAMFERAYSYAADSTTYPCLNGTHQMRKHTLNQIQHIPAKLIHNETRHPLIAEYTRYAGSYIKCTWSGHSALNASGSASANARAVWYRLPASDGHAHFIRGSARFFAGGAVRAEGGASAERLRADERRDRS
ncbi:hypothetical protein MKEN_00954700 [Mycena kentingensis (nom. inval.)]|nr:hypothetical protein MKEN_00954700 [Mycena kentingensis (nom. inval.)]